MPKKIKKSKKAKKAVLKKKAPKKKARKTKAPPKAKGPKAVGTVTHFYTEISVAIVRFNKKILVGARLAFRGTTTDFEETVKSMQYDHKPIAAAPKGKQVGIRVKKRVREGDSVYLAE